MSERDSHFAKAVSLFLLPLENHCELSFFIRVPINPGRALERQYGQLGHL